MRKVIYWVAAFALLGYLMNMLNNSGTKPYVRKHVPEAFDASRGNK